MPRQTHTCGPQCNLGYQHDEAVYQRRRRVQRNRDVLAGAFLAVFGLAVLAITIIALAGPR